MRAMERSNKSPGCLGDEQQEGRRNSNRTVTGHGLPVHPLTAGDTQHPLAHRVQHLDASLSDRRQQGGLLPTRPVARHESGNATRAAMSEHATGQLHTPGGGTASPLLHAQQMRGLDSRAAVLPPLTPRDIMEDCYRHKTRLPAGLTEDELLCGYSEQWPEEQS